MKISLAKRGILGLGAVVTAAALSIVPAAAASAAIVPTVGSAKPVYLISDEDGTQIPAGKTLNWNDSVLLSPDPSDEDYNSAFPVPANTGSVRTFISPRGQEANVNAWNAYGPLGLTPGGIQLPNGKPSGNTSAGLGTPSGSSAVAQAGGDYSLGIAFFNGNQVLETDFVFITVAANPKPELATWTFATPAAAAVAPSITTTSLNAATVGTAFSQTLAASGTAPMTWSVKTGTALPAGLSLDASSGVVSGTPTAAGAYSVTVVATNSAGANEKAFSGTVSAPAPTAPVKPTGTAANKVDIADPAKGAKTVSVPAGAANAGKTLTAWAWSDPTTLGQVTTDASGTATVDISSLPAGEHTLALTAPGDATFTVLAWDTFTKVSASGDTTSDTVDLTAAVTASDLWSLNAEATKVDFGSVARNASVTKALGKITVVDDRNVLKGWNLDAAWSSFKNSANDEIPASALTLTPKAFSGYTPISGVAVGTGTKIASSSAVSTLTTGALFDADLTFTAPKDAQTGDYTSTLTVTLTSK
ncbi:hypothetical protein DBR36_00350 [Microbacterium sp. HMWF026]|uniref:putative Ig domain-containing protein n=1 Tax=Microbacterium sp. HMWF026 TaxID=2056861 RepID=UPI000D3B97B3|nr:putative Ig domain-containing protein [Microbacterium sp. HMWF026]PTT23168.1 hypothetical protein DBR36_00350 [Microbacterium sp. HMWF026]